MNTKPNSRNIEDFIDGMIDEVTFPDGSSYSEDGVDGVDLNDKDSLRRVLKDGIYGVLWGQYSSKSRVKISDVVKNLKARGLTDDEIAKVMGR